MPRKPNTVKPAPKVEVRAKVASWWADLAAVDTPFEQFMQAARDRDVAMRCDPIWQRPEKLGQVGQL